VTLTDRDRKLLLGLVPIALLALYWFMLLAPKREEANTASTELTEQQERLDAARANLTAAQSARRDFDASYAQIVRLGKAIPSSVDMPSLLVQLDAAAEGTGIRFTKIATGERVETAAPAPATATPPAGSESGTTGTPAAAGGETAQSAPGAAAESANNAQQTSDQRNAAAEQSGVTPADTQTSTPAGESTTGAPTAAPVGLETVPLELEFQGNFFNLADFFHDVKRFVSLTNQNVLVSGRLVTVESVRWASDAEIFPKLRAEIKATIYLSPKAEGVTAGATPQGPATGDTVPAESAPVAPTAAVTP
jgi:Tfp pilus assembly protein PilO